MSTRRSKTTGGNDAIAMLMQDHKRVQKLFRAFERLDHDDPEACRELVELACTELKVHTTLEEEIFYPAVRKAFDEDDEALLDEAEIEHDTAKQLIARLESMQPDDAYYAPAFTVLSEYVKHHVKEEETEMFPKAKRAKLDLGELRARMRTRKQELTGGTETPGQAEPSSEAEGTDEPSAARALRQARRGKR
jgi:hemerythrin-like domain-containing protein